MNSKKKMFKRIVALVLAILLLVGVLPDNMVLQVSAEAISSYSVTLEGADEDIKEGTKVTLTNVDDETDTATMETDENGVAVFENFVDNTKKYEISVTGRVGYADYEGDIEKVLVDGYSLATDAEGVTALEKVTVNGSVADAEGNAVSGATIEYSAYGGRLTNKADENAAMDESLKVTTNKNGEYSFEIYVGVEYEITASGDTYVTSEPVKVTATEGDGGNIEESDSGKIVSVEDIKLDIQTYQITTEIERDGAEAEDTTEWGTVTFPEGDGTVEAGNSQNISIKAEKGYRIKEVTIKKDGEEQGTTVDAAVGEINYICTISNIDAAHTVTVIFEAIPTYTVTGIILDAADDTDSTGIDDASIKYSSIAYGTEEEDGIAGERTTANGGIYSFEVYEGLEYEVAVSAEGYEKAEGTENIYTIRVVNGEVGTENEKNPDEGGNVNAPAVKLSKIKYKISTKVEKMGGEDEDTTEWGTIEFADGSTEKEIGHNESANVTIKANMGYRISAIKVGDSIDTSAQISQDGKSCTYLLESVTGEQTITAVFEKIIYPITFTYNENGEVTDENDAIISDGGTIEVQEGKDASFKVTPNEGYHIEKIEIDDTNDSENIEDDGTYVKTFEGITSSHTVMVEFAINTYTIGIDVDKESWEDGKEWGIIKFAEGASGTVNYDGTSTVTIIATNPGYRIKELIIDKGTENEKKESIPEGNEKEYNYLFQKVTANHTLTAVFEKVMCEIKVNYNEERGIVTDQDDASLNSESIITVQEGQNTAITIKPKNGYRIGNITINETEVDKTDAESVEEHTTGYGSITYTFSDVTENKNIEVSFEKVEKTTDSWNTYLEFSADNLEIKEASDYIYVYSKDDSITIAPKTAEDKYRLNLELTEDNFSGWLNSYVISKDSAINNVCTIKSIQITSENIWNREFVNLGENKQIKVVFDKSAPEMSEVTVSEAEPIETVWWIKKDTTAVTISGTVTDSAVGEVTGSGPSYIVWSEKEFGTIEEVLDVEEGADNRIKINEDGTYTINATMKDTSGLEYKYYIYAIDNVNNVSAVKEVTIKRDTEEPKVTGFNFTGNGINITNFRTFSAENIRVTVTVTDGIQSSGLKRIELYNSKDSSEPVAAADVNVDEKSITLVEGREQITYTSVFTLTGTDFNGTEIYAKAIDKVSEESKKTKPTDTGELTEIGGTNVKDDTVTISAEKATVTVSPKTSPVYTVTKNATVQKWYDSNVEFSVAAETKNINLGIQKVAVLVNGENPVEEKCGELKAQVTINSGITASKEGKNLVNAAATTNTKLLTTKEEMVYIDTIAPAITGFEIKTKKTGLLSILTFGIFGKEQVEITVTADDSKDSNGVALTEYSGVKEITLYGNDEVIQTLAVNEKGQAVFTIPASEVLNNQKLFDKVISATATDNVGHTTEKAVTPSDVNSNIKDSGLMIETKSPTLSLTTDGIAYTDAKKRDWCKEDIQYTLTVGDEDSGIRSVEVKINDTSITKNLKEGGKAINTEFYKASEKTTQEVFVISTSQAKIKDGGLYTIEVTVTDNAGNTKTTTKKVYKDADAPYITGFEFQATGYQEAEGTSLAAEETEYGFYFRENTDVTVTAKDITPTAGIQYVTYYTVDVEGNKSKETTVKVDKNNQIKFEVKKNFKGQIYAKPTDNAGNTAESYVTPKGTILESSALHKKTSSIKYTMPKTAYKDEKGNNLYKGTTAVKVEIVDSYSGIREIEWEIIAEHDDKLQKGIVTVNENGKVNSVAEEGYNADCLGSWKVTKESNLVTKLTNTIKVSNDCNSIKIVFSLTDRAGNKTKNVTQVLSIDKTESTIQVSMDDNDDEEFAGFFQVDRNAEIIIHERNFENENVVFDVTRTDDNGMQSKEEIKPDFAVTMENGKAKSFIDENGIEYYEYKMNYVFSKEGDYTFHISSKDKVERGNEEVSYSNAAIDTAFTLDKTVPVIQVAYDNNNASNGKYFKEARTATITITEHNFEGARVTYTRTSSKNGTPIEDPTVSAWSSNGNVHTATINYSTDGDYTFEVTLDDKAGNTDGGTDYGSSVAANEFTVDTTIEKPVISGIENGKSYKDEVIPVIDFEDINFDNDEVTLIRTRKDEKDVDVTEQFITNLTTNNQGGEGTNNTFERIQENDGIYTLSVKIADMAGNEETEEVTFTVNRFGSVYAFDDYLISLQDSYVQEVTDKLVITEYNPDKLVEGSVKMQITCDGTPIEDVNYTIDSVVNEYAEVGESGWYQYEYVIDTSNFEKDGVYKLVVASEDEAGNKPETTNYKDYDVLFRVDTTKAEIIDITGLDKPSKSPQEGLNVGFEVFDAIGLKNVKVYINDAKVKEIDEFENLISYSDNTIELNEEGRQKIRFVVEDLAGNITDTASEDFHPGYTFYDEIVVSTNEFVLWFIEWYANKARFWGTIGGAVVVIGGACAAVVLHRRRKNLKK